MPVFRSADTHASARTADHPNHLAFRSLGPRYGRPPVESTWWLHTPLRHHKFTMWNEAKPIATVTAAKAKKFFQDIVVRFGVPNRIITDNGTQFTGSEFKDWCEEIGIKICYASMAHPQSNGQVERANGMVLQGVKSRVFDRLKPYAGKWARELPSVLWALRTSPSRATGETPFFLTYGSEAVLPTELEFGSPRVRNFDATLSEDSRLADLDQLEEARDVAAI